MVGIGMKTHSAECHSKYITWGGKPRPCNCGGGSALFMGIIIAVALFGMLVAAWAITSGSTVTHGFH